MYVGGSYIDDGSGGHIFANQMYVEKLSPLSRSNNDTSPAPSPIILVHGQAQTGTNFLNKPDGGRGWASHFLEAGHTVYILDQTFRGRSAWAPGLGATSPSTYSAEYVQDHFTAPARSNLWPQAKLHTQWPGTGVMGDAIFDAFYASNVQFVLNATYQQSTVRDTAAQLLDSIGEPAWILGHSQGGLMSLVIADARPRLVKGLVLLEPTGPPFREAVFSERPARKWGVADVPISYEPAVTDPVVDLVTQVVEPVGEGNETVACVLQASEPAPRQLKNLKGLDMLVVTSEAGYHAVYDYCTVAFLEQAGCTAVRHLRLGDVGIRGNGHFMFLERNSDEIWKWVSGWMKKVSSWI